VNSFQSELQDLITRWLANGSDPDSMRVVMAGFGADLERMAALKAEVEADLAKETHE